MAGIPFGTGNVVGSNNDYNHAYEMAASGEIGQVLRINLYDSNGQMGTHGFNIARKFAGRYANQTITKCFPRGPAHGALPTPCTSPLSAHC